LQLKQSLELRGISFIQYQQNFIPGAGSTGNGSALQYPSKIIIIPATRNGRPKTETPMGTYKSVTTRNAPKTANMPPETTNPLYIRLNANSPNRQYGLFRWGIER